MDNEAISDNPAKWITDSIVQFTGTAENTLRNAENEPAWEKPLVGFSRGDDPLWEEFKRDIGPFYTTPSEIFTTAFPSTNIAPEELTIITWVLPQTELTKSDHRKEKTFPSERWSRSRKYGEEFNVKLRAHLVEALKNAGYEAVAPQFSPLWKMAQSEKYGLSSAWSETCSVCIRPGYFWIVRWIDYPPRKGHALRVRHCPTRCPAHTETL